MDKTKLSNGTVLNISNIEVVYGALKISTPDFTVEELAELFSAKENTALITIMTAAEQATGYKTGFTSFSGIQYDADGTKTIELFQPVDVTEQRLSNAESNIILANEAASNASAKADGTDAKVSSLEETINTLLGVETEVEADE